MRGFFVYPGDTQLNPEVIFQPGAAYTRPDQVLEDPDLSREEKRAILSSWASDACAVESAPSLRLPPGAAAPIPIDDIIAALRSLDGPDQPRPGGVGAPRPPSSAACEANTDGIIRTSRRNSTPHLVRSWRPAVLAPPRRRSIPKRLGLTPADQKFSMAALDGRCSFPKSPPAIR